MADQSIDKTVRMTEVIKILLDNAPVVNTEEEKTKYISEIITGTLRLKFFGRCTLKNTPRTHS